MNYGLTNNNAGVCMCISDRISMISRSSFISGGLLWGPDESDLCAANAVLEFDWQWKLRSSVRLHRSSLSRAALRLLIGRTNTDLSLPEEGVFIRGQSHRGGGEGLSHL